MCIEEVHKLFRFSPPEKCTETDYAIPFFPCTLKIQDREKRTNAVFLLYPLQVLDVRFPDNRFDY